MSVSDDEMVQLTVEERLTALELEMAVRIEATDTWRAQVCEWIEQEHAQTELLRTILLSFSGAAGLIQDLRLPDPPVWPLLSAL